jgi:solute carrier family 25 oxoglutarate transporter 11
MFYRIDAFVLRTLAYTTARVWAFSYFYDKINKDPRRIARPDAFVTAGVAGGFIAGVLTNPFEIVFNRMQVDEMYPEAARRNYKHFLDGTFKVMEEGALMRGSIANGIKLAAICSSMTGVFDLCKENSYFFFGPHWINRFWGTAIAVSLGTAVSLPFDHIRTRLHTMRPLPTGEMPYSGTFDCLVKIARYECQ